MTKKAKIEGTSEVWESGELGRDEDFVKIAEEFNGKLIDDSLDLQMISIRLQKSLIEEFKMIAQLHGLGYQPLIRQVLKRFADCEMKRLLREAASKQRKEQGDECDDVVPEEDERVAC